MSPYTFNTELYLWKNYASIPNMNFLIVDTDVWKQGDGYIARFSTREEAEKILLEAGLRQDHRDKDRFFS